MLVVFALTGPSVRKQENALDLYVLLDRSDSTEDLIDRGLPEWRRLLEESQPSRKDNLRFFNYAEEIAEAGSDGSTFTGSRALTRTNLALATLATIAARADAKRPSRVLLFTDGFSTEPLQESVNQLRARGVPFDFRLIRENFSGDYRIARVTLPERTEAGEPFPIRIVVRGPADGSFPLIIRRDSQVLSEAPVTVKNGLATVEFTDRIARTGSYRYDAEIRAAGDNHPGNNRLHRWIEVTGGPRVILVTRYENDPAAAVLRTLDLNVETVANPATLQPGMLNGARAVILNNVPAHEIPVDFLKALDFYVREQAGGLLMAGGKHSFGSGGYFQSAIDELLPVSMELKSEHRKLAVALAIVMDRSGSMAVGVDGGKTKMDLANSGAANAIELLGPMDQVTVFAVDSEPTTVVPLTVIGNKHRQLADRVLKVRSAGGGIFVHIALKAAWDELKKSKAGTRHVILFSDANDSEEPGDYKKLIGEMTTEGCTISVIGLGTKADVDAALLEDIAKIGGGRMFFSDRPMDIPKIFAQETVTIARSSFIDSPVKVMPTGRWSELSARATTPNWLPEIDGYNLSYARPDATVSLASADEYTAPLIAHARRGLGRTAAVSFPLGGEFSERVRAWDGYGDLVQTLGRFLTDNATPPGIALRHRLEGTRLNIDLLYDPAEWSAKFAAAPPLVRLRDDATGVVTDVPWRRIAPGHFTVSREINPGAMIRGAVQAGGHALPFGPVSVGSAVEWDFNPEAVAALRSASAATGGRELANLKDAWLRPPFVAESSLLPAILIALIPLILLEALLTRTDWKLPAFSRATREPKTARSPKPVKIRRPKPAPISTPEAEVERPVTEITATASERSSRYQRAKDRK